jgi:hypothetical protein
MAKRRRLVGLERELGKMLLDEPLRFSFEGDQYAKAVRAAERAIKQLETMWGLLTPEERMILRSRMLQQVLNLLEQGEK